MLKSYPLEDGAGVFQQSCRAARVSRRHQRTRSPAAELSDVAAVAVEDGVKGKLKRLPMASHGGEQRRF